MATDRPTAPAAPLPPGPRAPAVWQTAAWMARPGAFLAGVHRRYGDPATIRTLWTREPMVLVSAPAAVREVFALDPSVAPAGQSWEFLRPFAGEHSILLLDGPAHLAERRRLAAPFHGERVRVLGAAVAELAAAEVASWRGRVVTLERMRELTLSIILGAVLGPSASTDPAAAALRSAVEDALGSVRRLRRAIAMAVVPRDLGDRSPWGRFRLAVARCDAVILSLIAQAREAEGESDGLLAELVAGRPREEDGAIRDELVALIVGGHDSSAAALAWACERLARHPEVQAQIRADPDDDRYLGAVAREVLRARPPLTIAPRLLTAPVTVAGRTFPAGIQLAACLWLAMRREDLWVDAAVFRPARWLADGPRPDESAVWIPFGGGVRRCAAAPFAELELREVIRAIVCAVELRPVRAASEAARRSMLVVVPERGGEVIAAPVRPRSAERRDEVRRAGGGLPARGPGCSSRSRRG